MARQNTGISKKRLKEDLATATGLTDNCDWEDLVEFVHANPHVLQGRMGKGPVTGRAFEGETFLGMAACNAATRVVAQLIDLGCSLEQRTKDSELTPLGEVLKQLSHGRKDTAALLAANARLLIEKGARCDVPNAEGLTPIYATRGSLPAELVDLMIARGAGLDCRTENDGTPGLTALIGIAWENTPERRTTLERVLQSNVNVDPPVHRTTQYPLAAALVFQDRGCWETLLARGARLDFRDAQGRTVLHTDLSAAAAYWVLERAPELVDAPDVHGRTPLLVALQEGRSLLAGQLIAAGADLDLQDMPGPAGVSPSKLLESPEHEELAIMVKAIQTAGAARAALAEIEQDLEQRRSAPIAALG